MSIDIHPTAIVSEKAVIGEGTSIGAYCVIGPRVVIGKNNRIASHVVIEGNTRLAEENIIFQFSSIGAAPQDLKYRGEDSVLEIGSKNRIREFVTLQPGTAGGGMLTRIGSNNLFMANSHVGHDALIGDNNVFANSAALAGHVIVGSGITLGGLCGVHQFVRLGDFCILGAGSMISKDVPPFCIGQGDRAHLFGINKIALQRQGCTESEITKLRSLYKKIFLSGGVLKDKLETAKSEFADFEMGLKMIEFIASSERGVIMPRKSESSNEP